MTGNVVFDVEDRDGWSLEFLSRFSLCCRNSCQDASTISTLRTLSLSEPLIAGIFLGEGRTDNGSNSLQKNLSLLFGLRRQGNT
jgi:hypothetical protein